VVAFGTASGSGAAAGADGVVSLKEKLAILGEVYADRIVGIDATHVVMTDGSRIPIDDGRVKSHDEKLADADIEDMLSQVYPLAGCLPPTGGLPVDFEPGRIRNEAFFRAVYGGSKAAVAATLVTIDWFGQSLKMTRTLAVDRRIAAVRADLDKAGAAVRPILTPSAGTFVWRQIAGTTRASTHSYGIAIDIASARTDYWQWGRFEAAKIGQVRAKVPLAVVEAFERHGFVWGGNWYHYDTMHFEYRPELIAIGKLAKTRGCARP
jgi:hypothetical protein